MSSPAAASGREIVEAIDPRERFAKPAFPQEEQGGSGSANQQRFCWNSPCTLRSQSNLCSCSQTLASS
jgi:hypothetical protein